MRAIAKATGLAIREAGGHEMVQLSVRSTDPWHDDDGDAEEPHACDDRPPNGPDKEAILDARADSGVRATRPPTGACLVSAKHARCAAFFACALCLSAAITLSVFLPWFLIEVEPGLALEARTRATDCLVVGHTVLDTRVVQGNTLLLYQAALNVTFTMSSNGAAVRVAATSRFAMDDSWMSASVRDAFWANYPINATATCFYDGDHPTQRVAMAPGIDGLGSALAVCVFVSFLALVAAVPASGTLCGLIWLS